MNETVNRFYEAVSADGELREELVSVTEGVTLDGVSEDVARVAMADAVAAFAATHGFDLAAEDILAADGKAPEGELSDAELETVTGGGCGCFVIGAVKGCVCIIGGGAGKGESLVVCPLAIGG